MGDLFANVVLGMYCSVFDEHETEPQLVKWGNTVGYNIGAREVASVRNEGKHVYVYWSHKENEGMMPFPRPKSFNS